KALVVARALAVAVAVAVAAAGCGAISFDVSQSVPEQQVPGSPLGGILPSFLPQPFPITIDIQQETARRSTGPASSANLKQVEFQITPSSMRLAISTSPSRVSSETDPILRRYMR